MMSSTSTVVPTIDDSSRVEVAVPLRSEFASVVRLIAASLGADAGFSVDEIDDLRLALSEVFAALVDGDADTHSRVTIGFDTAGPGLVVTFVTEHPRAEAVLDELAASIIAVAVDEFHLDGGRARIVKHPAEQSAGQTDS
jgi:hypothetical protein